jgi:hypothetical protein
MWQTLAQLLPIGIAAAVSSIPIMATILILVSDKRREAGVPYLIGWVLGAALFVTIAMLVAGLLPESRPRRLDTAVGKVQIAIGVALIALGLAALLRRRSKQAPELPRWMSRVDSLDSGPAFGLGVALNARPKALLLAAAAGLILKTASLASDATLIAIAFFTVVATSTVVVPVVLTIVTPTRMEPRLGVARDWLTANGPALTAIMMIVVGLFIFGVGITHL